MLLGLESSLARTVEPAHPYLGKSFDNEQPTVPIEIDKEPARIIDLVLFKINRDLRIDIAAYDPDDLLAERMALLNAESKTIEDETRIVNYGREINAYLSEHHPAAALSAADMKMLDLANLTSDTGKSGPAHANSEQAASIARIFGIDDAELPNTRQPVLTASLEEFCRAFFADEANVILNSLATLGIPRVNPGTSHPLTMREFYNLHANWTHSILQLTEIPEVAVQAAVNHHMLENYPADVIDNQGNFLIGQNHRALSPTDVLVILLDKYDARRRRGNKSHAEAIQYLRRVMNEPTLWNKPNPAYDRLTNLPAWVRDMFNEYIEYLDAALDQSELLEDEMATQVNEAA